jgi:hypothetical protein
MYYTENFLELLNSPEQEVTLTELLKFGSKVLFEEAEKPEPKL